MFSGKMAFAVFSQDQKNKTYKKHGNLYKTPFSIEKCSVRTPVSRSYLEIYLTYCFLSNTEFNFCGIIFAEITQIYNGNVV